MKMIDVSAKAATARRAVAKGVVRMKRDTVERIRRGEVEKGDVVAAARLAGIMAAKRTPELVPLCHPIALTSVEVRVTPDARSRCVRVEAEVGTTDKTGVEMEALAAVCAAALTVYDMLKSVDRGMTFEGIGLEHKSGGRSGAWDRARGMREKSTRAARPFPSGPRGGRSRRGPSTRCRASASA